MAVQGGANQDTLITSRSGSRGLLSGRLGTTIVAVVVAGLLVFVACLMVWYHVGGGAWRSEVRVMEAWLLSPDRLELAACDEGTRLQLIAT